MFVEGSRGAAAKKDFMGHKPSHSEMFSIHLQQPPYITRLHITHLIEIFQSRGELISNFKAFAGGRHREHLLLHGWIAGHIWIARVQRLNKRSQVLACPYARFQFVRTSGDTLLPKDAVAEVSLQWLFGSIFSSYPAALRLLSWINTLEALRLPIYQRRTCLFTILVKMLQRLGNLFNS